MKEKYLGAESFVPKGRPSVKKMKHAADQCRGCDLYKHATQAVVGEGTVPSKYFFVGEQPGDQEDIAGKPFVGPAGRILDQALKTVGISRSEIFITNAVKHFKFKPVASRSGERKRRLHDRPSGVQIKACRPWLLKELEIHAPQVVIAMGATAAKSLLDREVSIEKENSQPLPSPFCDANVFVTYHPSFVLRQIDSKEREKVFQKLCKQLMSAKKSGDKKLKKPSTFV
jgi:uracil-DNA glycosylase family protein